MTTASVNREIYVEPNVTSAEISSKRTMGMRMRHLSWGAIIAGIVISLVTMLALHMFGLAVGAATINPEVELNPVEPALGTGAIIWMIASNLIALFVGGFVAGRYAGSPDEEDGVIHGLVTWGVVTLLTLFLLTSSIAGMVNGVMNLAGRAIGMAGTAVAEVAPEVADAVNLQGMTLQGVQSEIRTLMQQPATADQSSTTPAQEGQTTNTGNAAPVNSLNELELNQAFSQLFTTGEVSPENRQNFITLLAERTGITPEEATLNVDRWEQAYTKIRVQAEDTARTVSQAIADAVTLLAGALFAAMVVGAFAAGVGGLLGSPEREREARLQVATS